MKSPDSIIRLNAGLTATAEYFLRDDGGVKVINKGFSATENKWKEAEGKAYFVRDPQRWILKQPN